MPAVVTMKTVKDIVDCAFKISQVFMAELPDLPPAHHKALMELDAILCPLYLANQLNGTDDDD